MNWKEPQTGKKTVTAADLKIGMYFRYIPDGSLRQLVGNGVVYHVICPTDGSRGNEGSLDTLAGSFNRLGVYELLDEQPVLIFPAKVSPDPIPEPAPRVSQFDLYSTFAAYRAQAPEFNFVEAEPEPTVTEIQLADGTTIVITTSGK